MAEQGLRINGFRLYGFLIGIAPKERNREKPLEPREMIFSDKNLRDALKDQGINGKDLTTTINKVIEEGLMENIVVGSNAIYQFTESGLDSYRKRLQK